ncbi:FabD/lysophospholipase-like protein [Mycena olivaceomarginata]|nr:FabD/lysophospholipase-like protein [Mycena olivaceomarginata]
MLIILEHLMYRLKVQENLPIVPHPCDYFNLIGGTSTGGLIALMLGRLRMSVEDAVKSYGQLAKEVFSDVKSPGSAGRFKASRLEKAIKGIVRVSSASQDPEEKLEDIKDNACKMFVCAMNAANMSLPVLLRTYNTPDHPAMDCTIWQAGRATSAAPTFFKPIKIGRPGMEEKFVDGGMGYNNPMAALLLEAKVLFPDRQIACIISLGTGQPHTINLPKPSLLHRFIPLDIVKAIQKIATDCEKEHQSLAHRFDGVAKLYFRFNVEQGMQDIQLNQWEKLGDIAANTRQYVQSQPVVTQLTDVVKSLSEKIGRVPTAAAAPLDETKKSHTALSLVQCPPPSPIFQGRKDILTKMDEYFSKDIGRRHVYVLHGLGGSGKTQIALKFLDIANQYSNPRFTQQFFINASSVQTLNAAFKNIAIAHKMGNSLEDGLLWLVTQIEEWILLFDNADDTNINLFGFFPKCTHGNIIITSRNPQLAAHGPMSHSKVGDMDEANAIDLLLLRAAKEKTVETAGKASEIVKELFCLPLAIVQAGAYISKCNCLHRYLSIYQQNCARLLQERPEQSHDDYKWTVYTTLQISFERLSPLAAEFLQMCSLLHYKNITEDIFKQAAAWTAKDEEDAQTVQEVRNFLQNFLSASGTWDPLSFMHILAEIEGYSLLDKHAEDIFSIHPLVHSWCQSTLKDEPKARECMIAILGMSVRFTEGVDLWRLGLMPHVESLIQNPATVNPVFQEEYAQIYFDSGRFRDAELLQIAVLEKWKMLLAADHPDTLLAMGKLAFVYQRLGRDQEAELL